MSEQIKQLNAWVKIGKFEYFNLWNETIKSLIQNWIIAKKDYLDYGSKRPDWLLIDRSDKKSPKVIAVIEYKDTKKFKTEKDQLEAIRQCNNYAQVLWATFWIATDTNVSVWINPKSKKDENNYIDEKWYERSFDFIRDDEQQQLSTNFYFNLQETNQSDIEKLSDEVKETYNLITRILESDIWENKSDLKKDDTVDPTNLAKSVWQDIYVATWKKPTKCLYNVVELFIFKFLSDLDVLDKDYNFTKIVEKCKNDEKDALEYYAENVRPRIRKLFPSERESWIWLDNTTIINWTIFVENWKAVLANAMLFKKSIDKYDKFWPLKNIDKSFKIRLYETFLQRDSWVKWMGQFFTPRKIVWNIVEMAKVENLREWARVCDPFCWVWGFPLEVMTERKNKDFIPTSSWIKQNIKYFWFDKWNDSDAERTIILAKANMLIYLSDLVKNNRSLTKEFARVFNETFKLQTWTLWTLANVSDKEEEKFDLIITNPPYVTSWSSILKDEIKESTDLQDFYRVNWTWVESLSLEWVINKLKKWWKWFIILPEWILRREFDLKIRKLVLDDCYINWIISLPSKTFFTTPQKTYILAITKKDKKEDKQIKPVFTYLVTDIWETLDVNRFDTGKSDLEKAKNLFRMFEWNESYFTTDDKRFKVQSISKFEEEINNNWLVDKWWTVEEKNELWISEENELVYLDDFKKDVEDLNSKINDYKLVIDNITSKCVLNFKKVSLYEIVDIERWKSKYTQLYCNNNKWEFPLYSAKTSNNWLMWEINTFDHDTDCLTYTTNWVKSWTIFYRNKHKFSINWDSAIILIKKEFMNNLSYKYLYYVLKNEIKNYWFNWENKATPDKVKKIVIEIPINIAWDYDLLKQNEIAEKYEKIEKIKNSLIDELVYFENLQVII